MLSRALPGGEAPPTTARGAWAHPCLRYPNEYSKSLLEQIETEYQAAYGSNDPHKIRMFLTRRMCQWQSGSVNRYLDEHCMALAKAAMVPREEFAALTDGLACWCGFDLGKRIKAHGFMPEYGAQRHEPSDRVPYIAWAQGGYCTLTPGDVTDNGYVDNWISAGEREHDWEVLGVD